MNSTISKISEFVGKTVSIQGWLANKRTGGGLVFLQIRDGSGFIQATVVKGEVPDTVFEEAKDLMLESSLEVKGIVKSEPRAPGGYEITVTDIHIYQAVKEEYPIGKKDHGPDFLLSHRHLWLRSKRQWAILRIRDVIISSMYGHLHSEGFLKIDSPILTPNACEGTTTLFPVPYLPAWKNPDDFKKYNENEPYAFLSQSGQLYIEAAIFAHRKVFDFGPTFRAEKSKTRRHLTEFWMMDAEAAFCDHAGNMKNQEKLIVAVVSSVLESCSQELKILDRDTTKLEKIVEGNFPVITHAEATEMLRKKGHTIGDRDDFGAEDETILSNSFEKPLFIQFYPKEVKAFYMKSYSKDPSRVLNDDLLAPEGYGEIIGGSQREDDYDTLLTRMKDMELPIADYQWYLDLRKFGSVVHSGYGIGLERFITWICKLDHLRESIPFPRMMERFNP